MKKYYLLLLICIMSVFVATTVFSQQHNTIDDFEDGDYSEPEWWQFDKVELSIHQNDTGNQEHGTYSLEVTGEVEDWYSGGIGIYVADIVDASQASGMIMDVYGYGDASGQLTIEIIDDDNGNWDSEQDNDDNPLHDDQFIYQLNVDWTGWKTVNIPFSQFQDGNPDVGDGIFNPDRTDGDSGGLLECNVLFLGNQASGNIHVQLDNITIQSAGESQTTQQPAEKTGTIDKWTLWSERTHLRGTNIHQARVYLELDGTEFKGPGPVGPPFVQKDFDRLAELGANYVNISHPGLFTESPPYKLDSDIQTNLDKLLDMIANADMFAVISFRTGPGRSEFTFFWEEVGDWFDESYLNDKVWEDQVAQDAWVEMWRYTAEYYHNHPVVVGYDLMVEPNGNDTSVNPGNDEPEEFYAKYENTLYDWNRLHPRITKAIREVDPDTPILIGGMGYSAVEWLPYLKPTGDPRTVYIVHQYAPYEYTHQYPPLERIYPGDFDADWDGNKDEVNRNWLENVFSTIDTYVSTHEVSVATNEFGLIRWEPGVDQFMDDQMDLFEQRGMNHALWLWDSSWKPMLEEENAFTFRFGPDPKNRKDVKSSDLMDVIKKYWSGNTLRPSNVTFTRE